jgi:DnaJ-class molecular chaperone
MNNDLYAILGVKRTATNDEIRRAYRKLAKDLHPDQNKNDKRAEEQFKKVSAAFAVLGNPEKRKRYDAGEIDAMGNERANPFYREYAGGAQGFGREYSGGFGGGGSGDFSDLFGDLFGRRGQGGAFTMRGMDYRYTSRFRRASRQGRRFASGTKAAPARAGASRATRLSSLRFSRIRCSRAMAITSRSSCQFP